MTVALLTPENQKVWIKEYTKEMEEWLNENIGHEDNYEFLVVPNRVMTRHVLVPRPATEFRPAQQNEYKDDGYYVCFNTEAEAAAFKIWVTE